MKKLLAIAALLLASTAAQASTPSNMAAAPFASIPNRGTVQIPGVYDNTGRSKAKRSRNDDADRDRPPRKPAPQEAKTDRRPIRRPRPRLRAPAAPLPTFGRRPYRRRPLQFPQLPRPSQRLRLSQRHRPQP